MAINYNTRKQVNTQLSKKGSVPREGLRKEYHGQSSKEEATERALVRPTTRGTLARTKKRGGKLNDPRLSRGSFLIPPFRSGWDHNRVSN